MEVVAGSNNNKQRRIHFTRSTNKTKSLKHYHDHHIHHHTVIKHGQKGVAQKLMCLNRSNSLRSSSKNNNVNNKNNNCYWRNINLAQAKANLLNNNTFIVEEESLCFGDFTREVYNAICVRLGDTKHIPEDTVQALFNDMQLYPSKSQVSKMLQCARQCGRRNGATNYITYGEFCVFASEMRKQHSKPQRKTTPPKTNNKCPNNKCDVFLGGSCNPTTWRTDTAIPELKKQGITFYNPQVSAWAPELVAQEYDAKQRASVLLFVLDSETRSTVGMVEVAYLVAAGRCVVLVAQPYTPRQTIMGEAVSDREYRDLVDSQTTLLELVKSQGIKIHTNLSTALQCTANILRNTSSYDDQLTQKLRRLRDIYESYSGNMKLYNVLEAYEKLTNKSLEINRLYHYLGNKCNNNLTSTPVTFERFCALIAEFSTSEGCNGSTTINNCSQNNVWAAQPFQRQCSTTTMNNNNSCPPSSITDNAIYHQNSTLLTPTSTSSSTGDIFLGGSIHSGFTWRSELAIPLIERHGLLYYNPTLREKHINDVDHDDEHDIRDVLEWRRAIEACKVLLMVITDDARSMTSIIIAGYYMGMGKEMVLCVKHLPQDGCVIANETLSKIAVKDYNRARTYLTDLANRRQVPVFENITEAVECAIDKCKSR